MGENARKRLIDVYPATLPLAERDVDGMLAADPQLAADIALGAALNSDKAERVLIDILMPSREHHENCKTQSGGDCNCWFSREKPFVTQRARAILAALREGLAE